MNALAIIEQPHNPTQLPSLPAWLRQRSAAIGSASQPDSQGRSQVVSTLPEREMLTADERDEVARHVLALEKHTDLRAPFEYRDRVLSNSAGLAAMIAALLLKGGRKLDQASSDAATEDYLDALEDLPAWSVREAVRKWNRGESSPVDGRKHDFNWRPEPPILRRLALYELAPVKTRIADCQKLLTAVPRQEFSQEHCIEMKARLKELAGGLASFPTSQAAE